MSQKQFLRLLVAALFTGVVFGLIGRSPVVAPRLPTVDGSDLRTSKENGGGPISWTPLTSLVDPQKLATLGERGANPRLQKTVALLIRQERMGLSCREQILSTMRQIGWAGSLKGELTTESLLRNVQIAREFGCDEPEGIAEMQRGQSPTIGSVRVIVKT